MNKPQNSVFASKNHAITHAEFQHYTMPPCKAQPSLSRRGKTGFNPIGLEPLLGQPKQLRMAKRGDVTTAQFYNNSTREVFKPIWDAIRRVIADALQLMARPAGVMVRFTLLSSRDSPSKVMQRVVERLKRVGSTCLYVWSREVRPEDYEGRKGDYEHYHATLLFDRRVVYVGTIKKAFDILKELHWIESYYLSREAVWIAEQSKRREQIKVHDLSSPAGVAAFEKHAAYLAKTETKEYCRSKRVFGSTQKRTSKAE
jgi:hypothetical protein